MRDWKFFFITLTSYILFLTSLQIVLLDILEVLVGSNLQLVSSGLVANDDTMLVSLQGRDGPCLTNGALNSGLQGASLVVAVAENHDLAGSHHGAYTNGQGQLGHLVHVVIKET